jgi:hypothetical protein
LAHLEQGLHAGVGVLEDGQAGIADGLDQAAAAVRDNAAGALEKTGAHVKHLARLAAAGGAGKSGKIEK